jgi:hypothetical protein
MIRPIVAAGLLLVSSYCIAPQAYGSDDYQFTNGLFQVPLRITDNSGFDRVEWPVSSGIPLPAGAVTDTAKLVLVDELGTRIPAQFKALSKYSARDNSIRWVLADFQVSLEAHSTRQLVLTNLTASVAHSSQIPRKVGALVLTERNGNILVDTGPLQAIVSARDGRIFDSVVIDNEQIISRNKAGGPYVRSRATEHFKRYTGKAWNTHGWERDELLVTRRVDEEIYSGRFADAELVVEERGPLRATLRIRGTHVPPLGKQNGVSESFYNYTIRLHFYAGKSFVKVQLDVENSSTKQSQWNLPFLEAGLLQGIELKPDRDVTFAFLNARTGKHSFGTVVKTPGNTIRLEQGVPDADKQRGVAALSHANLLSVDASGRAKVVDAGNIARFMDVSDGAKGLTLGIRYFWQEGPRAIELSDEHVKIIPLTGKTGLQSGKKKPVYELDFGQRYLSDLLLYFHGPSVDPLGSLAVIEAFEYPLVAYAPTTWYADTETWYFEVDSSQTTRTRATPNSSHWTTLNPSVDFRRVRTNYNSGGHHESLNSSWLSFLLSGSLADYERLEVSSRRHIARNPGWVYRDNVITARPGRNVLTEVDQKLLAWDRLAGFGQKDFHLWLDATGIDSNKGGSSYFNQYKQLPDMEHYANFILFEYYFLTGDKRALDSIHGFVNWALNFQHKHLFGRTLLPLSEFDYFSDEPEAMRRGHYARIYSWMLYSTLAGYHATDSPVMDHFAVWQIRRALSLLRHRHGQFTSWNVKPGLILSLLDPYMQRKLADHFDNPLIRKRESVYSSSAQSWMEAQNALALHEAYKTYQDERILDALWGMADYFSHHVIFYPEIGAFTGSTGMPTPSLTSPELVTPRLHDRHIQVLPVLYHYTGWKELEKRYRRVEEVIDGRSVNPWFTQTWGWEKITRKRHSSEAPERISDLRLKSVGSDEFTLTWTSPVDDGPLGRASRYFVKVSDKPIVEFAPTDNPLRRMEKARIVSQVERGVMSRKNFSPGKLNYSVDGISVAPETSLYELAHPRWHEVDAFWMAEHADGEPVPQAPGRQEQFTVRELNLHNWFGSPKKATLPGFGSDTLFVAICSWDEDNNLSELSNVVKVTLR